MDMEMNKSPIDHGTVEELSDAELNNVTGGSNLSLHFFDTEDEVYFIFFPGDKLYVKDSIFSSTVCCKVVSTEAFYDPQYHCYVDMYIVRDPDGYLRRVFRDDIVNQAV